MNGGVQAAFSARSDGDLRGDLDARRRFSHRMRFSPEWATVHQVHGARVIAVEHPGTHGDADALVTTRPDLPLAVFTADCLGVVVDAGTAVGVAHAGWRGLVAGVVESTVQALVDLGGTPVRAMAGPAIGPCCYEVGGEVAARFPEHLATTTWGTTSVDLIAAAGDRLGLPMERAGACTRCGADAFSHRRDASPERMAAVGWLT